MSIQTMLNHSSFDVNNHDSSSEEEEDEDDERDSDDSDAHSDASSDSDDEEDEEEEEDYEEYSRKRPHNRPTRKFGVGVGRANSSSSGSGGAKKYNSISWPEKITAVMLKYGGGQGRAGDICKWIQAEYIEDIDDSKNWKNTVSAFLSNNKRFIKGDPQGASRAAVWKLSTSTDDHSDSANGNDLSSASSSRKRRRPGPISKPAGTGARGGAVTRGSSNAPLAKRRKFAAAAVARREDSSDDEEEEEHLEGSDSEGHMDDDIEEEKKISARPSPDQRRASAVARALKPTQPSPSPLATTSSDAVTSAKPKVEQKKMWPDRIEEVLLKHGGQGMAHEIHRWIEEDFTEDTVGKPGWKNLVSAHLSSNKKFVREQRAGKQGGVWSLRSMQQHHQTSERRQPVALLSRNSTTTAATPSSTRD